MAARLDEDLKPGGAAGHGRLRDAEAVLQRLRSTAEVADELGALRTDLARSALGVETGLRAPNRSLLVHCSRGVSREKRERQVKGRLFK